MHSGQSVALLAAWADPGHPLSLPVPGWWAGPALRPGATC